MFRAWCRRSLKKSEFSVLPASKEEHTVFGGVLDRRGVAGRALDGTTRQIENKHGAARTTHRRRGLARDSVDAEDLRRELAGRDVEHEPVDVGRAVGRRDVADLRADRKGVRVAGVVRGREVELGHGRAGARGVRDEVVLAEHGRLAAGDADGLLRGQRGRVPRGERVLLEVGPLGRAEDARGVEQLGDGADVAVRVGQRAVRGPRGGIART
jgi:hypothetical protein